MKKKYFKSIAILLLLSPVCNTAICQGLYNRAKLIASGNVYIIVQDGGFNNEGTFAPGKSSVVIGGVSASNISTIGGSSATTFNNLIINKSTNESTLSGNISVNGSLTMQAGNLELNLFNIDLGNGAGTIVNENSNSRITGVNGGTIIKTIDLHAPSSANPGNIGIAISSAADLGNTVIKRGHLQQTSANSGYGIHRYFDIAPANNVSLNATLQLFYFDGELSGINKSELNFYSSGNSGANWAFVGKDNSDQVNNWVSKNNIDQLSRWTLASNIHNPLPLKLLSFTAALVDNQANLQWITENEMNTGYFDVQRSADGANFDKLLTVPAQGNNTSQTTYHALDVRPFNGRTYYRLKEVDIDGKFTFSPIVDVLLHEGITYSVSPNPSSGIFYLNINVPAEQQSTFGLYDAGGRLLQEQQLKLNAGGNRLQWNISQFAKGIYYLRATGSALAPIKIVKL